VEHRRLHQAAPRDIWYVSTEHTEADIDETLERAAERCVLPVSER
jgi:hypothetical protein